VGLSQIAPISKLGAHHYTASSLLTILLLSPAMVDASVDEAEKNTDPGVN
jgi:hypothetical protein